jgi:hypothetical protein
MDFASKHGNSTFILLEAVGGKAGEEAASDLNRDGFAGGSNS